ncbi:type I restriction enzyme HsdR N-terminal domain-containing protein [Sinomicrobium kalidii]|uniref:type I restriction endonuclease n=1 Tax=Sinomicrobium kalidii TaxID=2900738 RepID=UPI001E4B92F5|nr:type I restriction endonuclease [Sinomicrobium kalidii]UGU16021.1 type I restriction enzyme HsdR N-terminal domain-containing protein [Sinomicrobium kalidii]
MELYNQLKGLADKVEQLKDRIDTEESTKHAFTLPFINILGYDTFNPTEVVPEFTADVGLKKGEKVDYAIFQNGDPILIVECKHWKQNLDVHNSQLFRYFHVTKTRFALLTNGVNYRFYTDLEETNKMDKKPFLEFDITRLKENTAKEIEKFHKSKFDVLKIIDNASNLKYTSEIKAVMEQELAASSHDFVKLFANRAYGGRLTAKVMEEFTEIVNKAFNQIISEKVNDRLNSALNKEQEKQQAEEEIEEEPKSKIETTEEELEAYQIVLAILRRKVDKSRVVHRDTQSYFGILLDDNNRKPICRLHLNGGVKYISLFDEDKNEIKEKIESIDDIYKFEKQLLDVVAYYDND